MELEESSGIRIFHTLHWKPKALGWKTEGLWFHSWQEQGLSSSVEYPASSSLGSGGIYPEVKQPGHEAGHLLVYLVCIYLCTVLVRTDFEKLNFHPKYFNNFCMCIVIEVLNGQIVMCVGFLSAVIVQSTSSKTKYVLTAMNLAGSVFGFGKTEIYVIYLFVHICLCHWLSAFWMAVNFIFISVSSLSLLEILDFHYFWEACCMHLLHRSKEMFGKRGASFHWQTW